MDYGLINCIDTKAKCRHLKILTCKGTLRQVFIRVFRYSLSWLVFSTEFCELLYPPSLCEQVPYRVLYTRIQFVRGGGTGMGSKHQRDKHLPQSPLKGKFFLDSIYS
jgi:hypothetical protein